MDLNHLLSNTVFDIVLYGSVVTGDFIEGDGDLDVIVFMNKAFANSDVEKIYDLHDKYRCEASLFKQLEGTYYVVDDNYKILNGLYIGTTRKGWKTIDTNIHGYVEQGMILQDHQRLNCMFDIEKLFECNWVEIFKEVKSTTNDFKKMIYKSEDKAFFVYALQTTLKNIYTINEMAFTTKSGSVEYALNMNLGLEYRDLMMKLKSLRYPFGIEKMNAFDLEVAKALLGKMIEVLEGAIVRSV